MNIGIIVYSQTGNTYSVAEKLKEKLLKKGHLANIERLTIIGDVQPNAKDIRFQSIPDVGVYDAFVFASPVQAFNLAPAMRAYMPQLAELEKRKAFCFVTMAFPFPWMGGKKAISTMKEFVESKGGEVCGIGIVNWSKREKQITGLIDSVSSLF